jgi:hypothetical protein
MPRKMKTGSKLLTSMPKLIKEQKIMEVLKIEAIR